MNEKGLPVLEQYDLALQNTYRGRGAVLLDTDQGFKLLKAFSGSKYKVAYEQQLLQAVLQAGIQTDCYTENREGELLSTDRDETVYVLKSWPKGRECDVKNEEELLQAMELLAGLHLAMRGIWDAGEEEPGRLLEPDLRIEFEKHNKELKKVQNFIRAKQKKADFELLYLKYAEAMLRKGKKAREALEKPFYEALQKEARELQTICHGEYIHHNVLFGKQGPAVVNFGRCQIGIQAGDLYLFLRKIMEKHGWSCTLGKSMLEAYERVRPLSGAEREYLAVRLFYPEKFWKLANHYYNTNKCWLSEKSMEKLKLCIRQQEAKTAFLENVLDFGNFL